MRNRIESDGMIISSAESFQRQGRPVIIISTVRTGELGFVKDPRVSIDTIYLAIHASIYVHKKFLTLEKKNIFFLQIFKQM